MNTLITNIIIVITTLLIIWNVDLIPNSDEKGNEPQEQDTIAEVFHPFTNDVKGADGELVEHLYYKLSYNEEKEQANWVAFYLSSQMLEGDAKRKNNFKQDPEVDTESAHKNDYKGTGYDKGHLMPAGVCKFDQTAMNETFFMSNMSPQYSSFNRIIWRLIELQVKNWTAELGHLYEVTGPAAYFPDSVIGENRVAVPSHFYKVILFKEGNRCETAAFLIKNEKSSLKPRNFLVTVDSVESYTGLDFFWELPDSLEINSENHLSPIFEISE